MAVIDKAEKEPILLDAEAAVNRLKELRELNTSLHEQIKAQKELLAKQSERVTAFFNSMDTVTGHFLDCGFNTNIAETIDASKSLRDRFCEIAVASTVTINTNIADLETQANNVQGIIKPLLELIKVGLETKLTPEDKELIQAGSMCTICYDRKVNRVYDGCGHTVCEFCVARINRKECHMCRNSFKNALTLYL